MALSKRNLKALQDISKLLEVNPSWLYQLISFESGWKPNIKNPYSSAKGLIQFIDKTAQELGYKNSQELIDINPTIEQQLRSPVYHYLKKYAPFPTKQSLYMAVFYPKARTWNIDTPLPDFIQKVNPGIDTVRSYIDKVDKKKINIPLFLVSSLTLIILMVLNKSKIKLSH